MALGDNPAYDNEATSTTTFHYAMWEPIYSGAAVSSSNSALRELMTDNSLYGRVETEARSLAFAVVDGDGDGDPDPIPDTAEAGEPGQFTGTDVATPWNLEALNNAGVLPDPVTDWTTGESVVLANGEEAHWLADTLPATTGESDTEVFSSTAHGLTVNDIVIFTALTGGTGLTADIVYRVATVPTSGTFTLKENDGTAVAFSADLTASTAITGQYYDGPVE